MIVKINRTKKINPVVLQPLTKFVKANGDSAYAAVAKRAHEALVKDPTLRKPPKQLCLEM
jgi:hypothetical protein